MKSPFPGMDPYLEQRWSDVRASLIGLIREALQPELPSGLRARAEERVLLEELDGEALRRYRPDIAITDIGRYEAGRGGASAAVLPEPILVELRDGPAIDRFVQIIDTTHGNRVVTAIEVLSPWNKERGRLNKEYMQKINDYGRGSVSVVEIDLLRSPREHLVVTEDDLQPKHRSPYVICVHRAWMGNLWHVCPVRLQQPIPPVSIPLRQTDKEVALQLQPLIERVYIGGGHDDIDYNRPLSTPLSREDEAWADALLRQAGRRT
ncbi:MAG: DUF4058 family protein [Tepidisphaerales bacterium]